MATTVDLGNVVGVVSASAPIVYNKSDRSISITNATQTAAGALSADDKIRIDGATDSDFIKYIITD